MNTLLNIVKEKGIVSIINAYKTQLEIHEKMIKQQYKDACAFLESIDHEIGIDVEIYLTKKEIDGENKGREHHIKFKTLDKCKKHFINTFRHLDDIKEITTYRNINTIYDFIDCSINIYVENTRYMFKFTKNLG